MYIEININLQKSNPFSYFFFPKLRSYDRVKVVSTHQIALTDTMHIHRQGSGSFSESIVRCVTSLSK